MIYIKLVFEFLIFLFNNISFWEKREIICDVLIKGDNGQLFLWDGNLSQWDTGDRDPGDWDPSHRDPSDPGHKYPTGINFIPLK